MNDLISISVDEDDQSVDHSVIIQQSKKINVGILQNTRDYLTKIETILTFTSSRTIECDRVLIQTSDTYDVSLIPQSHKLSFNFVKNTDQDNYLQSANIHISTGYVFLIESVSNSGKSSLLFDPVNKILTFRVF